VLVATSKGSQAVKLCTDEISQFFTGGAAASSALTLLVGQQEVHPACKKN